MNLSFVSSFLFITSLSIIIPINVEAQQQLTNAQLTKQFRDGFLKGCLQGKTPGVKNQAKYCTCLANSYQSRYDGQILAAITQASGSLGNQGPALVNLMMTPETKACRSNF